MTLAESVAPQFAIPAPLRAADCVMSDGAIVRLRQHGRPGRLRLALSHGNGLAIDAYLPFWRLLLDEFEVIVFDVRNHGENPLHQPSAHTWDRIAQDMGEIRSAIQACFGAAPTIGVFHSLSAVAALMNEIAAGPEWSALVLFDPPIFPPEGHRLRDGLRADENKLQRRALRRQTHYQSPEQFAAQLARQPTFRRWVAGADLLFAQATLRPRADGEWVLRYPRELEARIYDLNVDPRLWTGLPALHQPVILIGADPLCPDASPPASICRAIHDELGVEYRMIADTTHFLQIEQPHACRDALIDFLRRHRLA